MTGSSKQYARSFGTVWIDSAVNIGAYLSRDHRGSYEVALDAYSLSWTQ